MLPPFIRANTRSWILSGSRLSEIWPWCIAGGITLVVFLPGLYLRGWILASLVPILLFRFIPILRPVFAASVMLIAGATLGTLSGEATLSHQLPARLIKQDLLASGQVQGLVKHGHRHQRFMFNISSLHHQEQAVNYNGPVLLNCYQPCPTFKSGQHWRMTLRLKPAHGTLNPGGFNYAQWLFSQSIRSSGYVRTREPLKLLEEPGISLNIDLFRTKIHQFIQSQKLSYGGLISALAVGIRDNIDESSWRVLRRTGTAHLVAISGLHIGMVAAIAYFICHFLWRHSLLRYSHIPAPTMARVGALVAAALYAALAGFALPTLRALLMLLSYFLLLSLRRNPGIFFSLGLVLLIVLIFDPLAPLSAGLWLSFTAVGVIAIAAKYNHYSTQNEGRLASAPGAIQRTRHWLQQWWQIQFALLVGLAPLTLMFFQQLSLLSMPANFLAIPLMAILVVPLILLSLILLSTGLSQPAGWTLFAADKLLSVLWPVLVELSELSMSIYSAPAPSGWQLIVGTLCAFLVIVPTLGRLRFIAAPGILLLLFPQTSSIPNESYKVHLLDVGQGLAVVVQTKTHSLVYDAGIHYFDGFDAGRAIVIPFLKQLHIKQIDMAVISHNNLDHYGGMASILDQYPTTQRYASAGFYAGSRACQRGHNWEWDGVQFSFIHPGKDNTKDDNNASCVLKIKSRFGSILLSGDIEQQAESALTRTSSAEIRGIDVLLAPHHGSKTSSSPAFLKVVNPRLILISSGYLNRFKHPHPKVMARYKARNIPTLNTAESGWIGLTFGFDGIRALPWREAYRRYWLPAVNHTKPTAIHLSPDPETTDAY